MLVEAKITGLDGVLDTLKSLPSEIVSKRGGPVKSALRKGALVIRDEARRNEALIAATANVDGRNPSTGLLQENIIATRGKPDSGEKGERYLVRVKSKKYADGTTTQQSGRFLEYGTSHQAAQPWLRPAVQTKGQQAIDTIIKTLNDGIQRVIKKLAAQNKGR